MMITSCLKVLTFFAVWMIIWLPIALVASRLISWQPNQPLMPQQKIVLLLSLYLLAPVVIGWKIKLENLSFIEIGLGLKSNIFVSILFGLAISLLGLAIVFAVESIFNLISWRQENIKNLLPLLLPILSLSLLISLAEEVVFRGYVFSILNLDGSFWFAAVISSLIFALLHLVWERKMTLPQIPGLWLMGMILVGARLVNSGDIYLALGLHGGWIWGLTCIDSAQLVTYQYQDNWFTGIHQQPLAGLAGALCLIITGLTLWFISPEWLLS